MIRAGSNYLAVCVVVMVSLTLVSCAPESTSTVYPQDMTGIRPSDEWSDSNWQAKLPTGWVVEPVFGMREASFRVIGSAGDEAEVSISRLPIQGGTLASNVNRWRVQAGLEPWADEQVISKLTKISISDYDAFQMEFISPNPDGQSIYGVILEEGKDRVFIKFSGTSALMESQLEAWHFFVENLELYHEH
ncbi:MAG: hypothetical protein AAF571_04055 [Verrucomicrobiota bacterium]